MKDVNGKKIKIGDIVKVKVYKIGKFTNVYPIELIGNISYGNSKFYIKLRFCNLDIIPENIIEIL